MQFTLADIKSVVVYSTNLLLSRLNSSTGNSIYNIFSLFYINFQFFSVEMLIGDAREYETF